MNITLRSLRAMKQPQLTAMLTAAIKCHTMLLDENKDAKRFQDFMNAVLMKVFQGEVTSYSLDERLGRLRFTLQKEGQSMEYEMCHIDNETRFYGSSQSSYGVRLRKMFGNMTSDWYAIPVTKL